MSCCPAQRKTTQGVKSQKQLAMMQLISLAFELPSFLTYVKQLKDLIAKSGLDERRCVLYAQGLLWTVIAFAFQETRSSTPKIKRRLKAASRNSPYPEITQPLAISEFGDLWSTTVEREIAGIVHLIHCDGVVCNLGGIPIINRLSKFHGPLERCAAPRERLRPPPFWARSPETGTR